MKQAFAGTSWIWYDKATHDLVNTYMQARRTFTLKRVPRRARLRITADTRYRLYVNGRHVCRGPARGFQSSWPFDVVDVADRLKRGRNVIAVLVHNTGVGTYQYVHAGAAGLLVSGRFGQLDVSTGPDWEVRPAPGFQRHIRRASIQMGFQERFDARLDDGSWLRGSRSGLAWRRPGCRAFGSMPWHRLEERAIPMLREDVELPAVIVSESRFASASQLHLRECPVEVFVSEERSWRPPATPARASSAWFTLTVPPPGRGRAAALCLDFARETIGSLELDVSGAAGGEVIDTLACEGLDGPAPAVSAPAAAGSRMAFGNRLILRPGRTRHEQFDHWGLRYLVLVARGARKPLRIRLRLNACRYPLEVRGLFESSDDALNAIHAACVRTQECCMLDAYVDCPWREQAQWWGDARVQAANTFHLSSDARLLARGIRQLGTQETPNGLTYGHAPTIGHSSILPDFTLTWVATHWDYYWQTGDLSLFRSMRDRVHRALAFFEDAARGTGLLPYDDRYWLFLDWVDIFKDGYPTLYNMLYLLALRCASDLFGLCRDHAAARRCARLAARLKRDIAARLFRPRRGIILGGLDWKRRPVDQDSPHTYAMAVLLDLFPEHHAGFAARVLLPFVAGDGSHPVRPSPFFTYYVLEALKKLGYDAEVVDCVRRWWGDMVDRGLSTCEEVWNAQPGEWSLCHAWSAHPIVHLANAVLGIRQTAPAWREILFRPALFSAGSARGSVPTPNGPVSSEWGPVRDGVRVRLRLPKGVSARVELPGVRAPHVRGGATWTL